MIARVLALLAVLALASGDARAQEARTEEVRPQALRWGADPSGGAPFAFFDPDDPDRVIGFEVDIMAEVARRLGRAPELFRADWLALHDALEAGRCDVLMNGFEVTDERAQVAQFSAPYFRFGQQIVVRSADAARVRSLADLAGRRIAVLNGSQSIEVLKAAGFGDELILQYDDSLAPYTEVALGRADAALAESIIAAYYAAHDGRLAVVPETFASGEYAAVTRIRPCGPRREAIAGATADLLRAAGMGALDSGGCVEEEGSEQRALAAASTLTAEQRSAVQREALRFLQEATTAAAG